jgi:hypothetical protein
MGAAEFEVGEFREAKWVALEKGRVGQREGGWSLEVNRDRNLSMVLVAAAGRMAEARKKLTELLTLEATGDRGAGGARGV